MILTGDADIVTKSVNLIRSLVQDNPKICRKLYLTGVFVFALMYTGSDLSSVAALLQDTHDKQDFNFA